MADFVTDFVADCVTDFGIFLSFKSVGKSFGGTYALRGDSTCVKTLSGLMTLSGINRFYAT